jgi:hypothetical protein
MEMIRAMLPTAHHMDKPYYENQLNQMAERLQKRREETRAFQPNYAADVPSYDTRRPPSPPPALHSRSLKRNLELTDGPEAKRVSRQPSPVATTPPLNSWSQSLPRRESNPVHRSDQTAFIDLTESDPPTPARSPQPPVQAHTYSDPFPELHNAYQGAFRNGHLASTNNFSGDYMSVPELAEFMMTPIPPPGGYGYQQQRDVFQEAQTAGFDQYFNPGVHPYMGGQRVPQYMGLGDSDGDDYGSFPTNPIAEAQAIEKLLENFKGDGEKTEEREPTPAIMTCTLKEYQRIGLTWLLKMERGDNKGGILADDMGLGKTVSRANDFVFLLLTTRVLLIRPDWSVTDKHAQIQALALICANPSKDPSCKTTLIIAPVALMRQWEKEIDRHIDRRHKHSVYLYHGSGKNVDFAQLRQYDVVLTTFGSLTSEYKQKESRKESMLHEQEAQDSSVRRKPKDKLALLGPECMWYRIIIDEAHNIKNRNGKASKACADLMAHHRLCMTGTPMMNNIAELYPLIRFLKVKPYCSWNKFNVDIVRVSVKSCWSCG